MDKYALRWHFRRLNNPNDIHACHARLDGMIQLLVLLISHHKSEDCLNERQSDARVVIQMTLTKLVAIKQIFSGVQFLDNAPPIIDATILSNITRSLYESCCMFNIVYRQPKSEDEHKIVYNLWVLAGLNERQHFEPITKSIGKEKMLKERVLITSLTDQIKGNPAYKSLRPNEKATIMSRISTRDYRVVISNNRVKCYDWQQCSIVIGDTNGLLEGIYIYLSLHAHPSNVAVFQFGSMFEKDAQYISTSLFVMRYVFMCASLIIADYIHYFPSALNVFESLPIIDQIIMDSPQRMLRGYDFSINNSYEILN